MHELNPDFEISRMLTEAEKHVLQTLCYSCQKFLRAIESPRVDLAEHPSKIENPLDLERALDAGHHVCTVVVDKILTTEQSELRGKGWYKEVPYVEYSKELHFRVEKRSKEGKQSY
jgi:hypothetical protein